MGTASFRWGRRHVKPPIKNWTELPNTCNHGEPRSLTPVHRGLTHLKSPYRLSLSDPGGSVVQRGLTPLDEGWHHYKRVPKSFSVGYLREGLAPLLPPAWCMRRIPE